MLKAGELFLISAKSVLFAWRQGRPGSYHPVNDLSCLARVFSDPKRLSPLDQPYRRQAPKVWQQRIDVTDGRDQIAGKSHQRAANPAEQDQQSEPRTWASSHKPAKHVCQRATGAHSWFEYPIPQIASDQGSKWNHCLCNKVTGRKDTSLKIRRDLRLKEGIHGNVDDGVKYRVDNHGYDPDEQHLPYTEQSHSEQAGNNPGNNDRACRAPDPSPGGQENTSHYRGERAGGLDRPKDLGIVACAQQDHWIKDCR